MPYLLKMTMNGEERTHLAATAVQALVLMRAYAAKGAFDVKAHDALGNVEISIDELTARAGQATD